MSNNYQVVFCGEIVEGCKEEEVIHKLAAILKEDVETIAKLFSGESRVIKRNASLATCEKIQKVFLSVGAICFIDSPEIHEVSKTEIETDAEVSGQNEEQQEYSQSVDNSSASLDAKETITSKIANIAGLAQQFINNSKKKYSTLKTEASASIESDIEEDDIKVLLKNKYVLSFLGISLVLLVLAILPFIYDSNPMPLNDKNLTHLAEHIDFIEKAFTTEELKTRAKDTHDYLDYLLVKPVRKMEYDFDDTVIEISEEFQDDDFEQAELVKIKPYLQLLVQERQQLNQLGFISAKGKKQLDKVSRKLKS